MVYSKNQLFQMGRKRSKGTKYSKITKQQKYYFLKLFVSQNHSIHEAAMHSGIQYSTAKTILFFHKHQHKSYSNYFIKEAKTNQFGKELARAGYKSVTIDLDNEENTGPRVDIVCKVRGARTSSSTQNDDKEGEVSAMGEQKWGCVKQQGEYNDGIMWQQQQKLKIGQAEEKKEHCKQEEYKIYLHLHPWSCQKESEKASSYAASNLRKQSTFE